MSIVTTFCALAMLASETTPNGKVDTKLIRIDENLNAQVPLDAKVTDSTGEVVAFGSLLAKDRPTVLTVGYYGCPMLCDIVLNGALNGFKGLEYQIGKEFQVVSLSIEPKETAELAREKRANYLKSYARPVRENGWHFVVGEASETKRVADAVGWHYQWDEEQKQWAHGAGIFVLTPEGKVSRVLYGITFEARDLKFALIEASQGKVGSAVDKLLLWCYHYDPKDKQYVIYAVRVMRVGGAFTFLALATTVGLLVRYDRRRQRAAALHV
jgi:protein SCO1